MLKIPFSFTRQHRLIAAITLLAIVAYFIGIAVIPSSLPKQPYRVAINNQDTMGDIADKLVKDGVIHHRWFMVALSRINGMDKKIQAGIYIFKKPINLLDILDRFSSGQTGQQSITIIEGLHFSQFRTLINQADDLRHDTRHLSDREILIAIGAKESQAEGLFFPSTYCYIPGSSDITIFRQAYRLMKKELNQAWSTRQSRLPYKNPYQLLIMASLIEKETGHPKDRAKIAAVFINRLNINMRLQTDPAVIYGLKSHFSGHLTTAQLRRDTPYNTYIRLGLTPTPIALPGKEALQAAAHPAPNNHALYFVARGDGTSELSENLNEHNAAVRKYILKKDH